jgi:hypothetical protein
MAISAPDQTDQTDQTGEMCRLQVDVVTTSKPAPGPERHLYRCPADIRISEGSDRKVCKANLVIRHPAGWMGVRAGFTYTVDRRQFPTFETRAERACLLALSEFPSEEHQIISVFLLGTGAIDYSTGQPAGHR